MLDEHFIHDAAARSKHIAPHNRLQRAWRFDIEIGRQLHERDYRGHSRRHAQKREWQVCRNGMRQLPQWPHNPAKRQAIRLSRVIQSRRANIGNFHEPITPQFAFA
jgi:hypothetical protein